MSPDETPDQIRQRCPKLEGAIWRGWNEVHAAINARKLLLEIHELHQTKIDSRKGIIFAALEDGIKMRLTRLLDLDARTQCAGLAYVRRCWSKGVEELTKTHSLDLALLDDLGSRLKGKRDLTLFHIDKKSVGKAAEVWTEDPIKWNEVDSALEVLRVIYAGLYEALTGNPAPYFDLTGDLPSFQHQAIPEP